MKTVEEWHRLMTTNPRDAGCLWDDIKAIRYEAAEEMQERCVSFVRTALGDDEMTIGIRALPLPGDES